MKPPDPSIFSKEYRSRRPEKKTPEPKPRKPINKVGKKLAKEKKTYLKLRLEFLEKPENMFCAVYPHLRSDQVHHKRGRGKNLNKVETWLAVSDDGHKWIEANPKLARERGFTKSRLHMTDELNSNVQVVMMCLDANAGPDDQMDWGD